MNKNVIKFNNDPYIISEIGINHNGYLSLAKKLIKSSVLAGADAVKFQKRTIELVYTDEELDVPRESPWGTTTRQQKLGLEFEKNEYDEINKYCKELNIDWFSSAWDIAANAKSNSLLSLPSIVTSVIKGFKIEARSIMLSATRFISSVDALINAAVSPTPA